ncbi:dinitrogenase iron-molybdenum cofactor biosynthesis protein [Desulfocurvibacter africanus PCS]|uniref:Dinitrogenase iron-molybdenum cofactor biosynthesis protein n=1 Tax=Desulfocurvibacter africanus PCS TaxID=1262666 RepID=M5PUI6_DESAF|nr:dinitrogenase iron-molybdenum cofactor biosynthesis protein [Desulfocurvibacter africanus PCS]
MTGAAFDHAGPTVLCLACHQGRLATLLETATELRFYSLERDQAVLREVRACSGASVRLLAELLAVRGASALICGALTGCCRMTLEHQGITVLPWIAGSVEQVLGAHAQGRLDTLVMPGCPGPTARKCPQGRSAPGRGRCRQRFQQEK